MRSSAQVRQHMVILMAAAAMLCSAAIRAQPRAEPKVSLEAFVPVTEPAAMAEWLKRLAGRYTVDGMVHVVQQGDCGNLPPDPAVETPPAPPEPPCQPIKGKADCVGVGTGPGVHCILNAMWLDIFNTDFENGTMTDLPGGVSYLDPSMILFGLDPGQAAVNYMLVDSKGLPEGTIGSIVGHKATFTTQCVNIGPTCERVLRVEAREGASLIYLSIDIRDTVAKDPITSIVMTLRRASPEAGRSP
jgi:hypothetical protein